jgi:hypothetical protein
MPFRPGMMLDRASPRFKYRQRGHQSLGEDAPVGHEISAYLGPAEPSGPYEYLDGWPAQREVASLRRGASSPLRHRLYEALGAHEYDGDVSGVWAGRWFNRGQLQRAVEWLQALRTQGLEVGPEIEFIESCLAALPPNRFSVFIAFG